MPDFSTNVLTSIFKRAVTGQGGLLTGQDPTAVNTSDPLRLWIIQLGIIVLMAQALSLLLGRIKQPKVIAEVLGGILLGPTAFGRIPGFTEHIFPAASLSYLSLVANIGLCLFLFIIGLEIDASIITRNARLSVVVSLAGIVLPFGIGCAISVPLYSHFISSAVHFPYFMLFIGVTYSITAFPVLCRILTALKLLDTTVGLIVLSAGVANDVISWSLLALCVAFVNASSGLTALWTFLICVAFTLFLLFPVKRALLWLARKTGSTSSEPTMLYMTVVMLVLWASSFFTDFVGVNAIFGAFLAGVIVPREGGLAIALTEKLEDMVTILFLPLYFTLSGLNTNLGLINDGTAWGFVFAVAALDFTGKFTGCTLASRYLGFTWREASTVGSLMSCKGLVELIVLNVGLAAGILTQQVFSMFVLEALILTFMTTPMVNLLYPPSRRTRVDVQATQVSALGDDSKRETEDDQSSLVVEERPSRHRFTVVLDKFDHMPGIMALTQLVVPPSSYDGLTSKGMIKKPEISVDALRLIELSERTSAVMKSSIVDTLTRTDPLLCVFKMFAEQSDIPTSTALHIVPQDDFAHHVAEYASGHGSHLVLLPWVPPCVNPTADTFEGLPRMEPSPFGTFFGTVSKTDTAASTMYSHFVRSVFMQSKTDVAVSVDTPGDRTSASGPQHILVPFFGGADDRLALELVVQLCAHNPRMSATVVRVTKGPVQAPEVTKPLSALTDANADGDTPPVTHDEQELSMTHTPGLPDTVYAPETTTVRLASETADNILWARYTRPTPADTADRPSSPTSSPATLARIHFDELTTPAPLRALTARVQRLRDTHRRVLVVAGRSKRFETYDGEGDHAEELKSMAVEDASAGGGDTYERGRCAWEVVRKTVGDVGAAFVLAGGGRGVGAGVPLVVVQAGGAGVDGV